MVDEKLQFAISQYLDGTLPPDERAAVELRLQADAEARAMADEFRAIDALVTKGMPVPELDWESLSQRISAAVDEQIDRPIAIPMAAATSRWGWRPLALAASVAFCAAIGVMIWNSGKPASNAILVANSAGSPTTPPVAEIKPAVTEIAVLNAEPLTGEAVLNVEISQGTSLFAAAAGDWADVTSVDRSTVAIAATPNARDRDADSDLLH